MTSNTRSVQTDALLKLLANQQRRTVLHHLRQNGADPVPIDELVDVLVPLTDEPPTNLPQNTRRRLRISLQHVHLPRLADAGTLDYDPHAATVRYTPVDRVEALLEFVTHELD